MASVLQNDAEHSILVHWWYLTYMEANGYANVLSLKMFGWGSP